MGLWQQNPACDLSSQPPVSSFNPTAWTWMSEAQPPLANGAPVYAEPPGGAIYRLICNNCHGPNADSAGRQANNLAEMTGGDAIVTDLRNGLFGTAAQPGYSRQQVFGPYAPDAGISVDDLAVRYFAWMALGGTKQTIPASILQIVANTDVLGVHRPFVDSALDANMLSTAETLCQNVLPIHPHDAGIVNHFRPDQGRIDMALIWANGDAELWSRVCELNNTPLVRAIEWDITADPTTGTMTMTQPPNFIDPANDFYPADPSHYPSDAWVADHQGNVVKGVTSDNLAPWCLRKPKNAAQLQVAQDWIDNNPAKNHLPLPFCPTTDPSGAAYIPPDAPSSARDSLHLTEDDLRKWALKGAINAGILVFLYVNDMVTGKVQPKPAYNHCELLGGTADGGP
jgi:hypothetical protein